MEDGGGFVILEEERGNGLDLRRIFFMVYIEQFPDVDVIFGFGRGVDSDSRERCLISIDLVGDVL